MPEGDTVYRTALRLRMALAGRELLSSDFRVPRYATLDLAGRTVADVVPYGKHLFIRAGDLSIHSHLMMEGHWDVYAAGARWRSPAHTARCVLTVEGVQVVGFELGFLRVVPAAEEQRAVEHLGPDPLGPSWDAAEVRRRMLLDPGRATGLVLLDQRVVAGLGNIYRCEVLFLARVHPLAPTGSLADSELDRLIDLCQRLLNLNKDRGRRITTGTGGREPYWVYGRGGKPCQRCGAAVVHQKLGDPELLAGRVGGSLGDASPVERDVYFCPRCQAPA